MNKELNLIRTAGGKYTLYNTLLQSYIVDSLSDIKQIRFSEKNTDLTWSPACPSSSDL